MSSSAPGAREGGLENEEDHALDIRVYYEDTDLGGVVYYANYLKFMERGRTEWLRGLGVDQMRLKAEAGLVFVVRRCLIDYLKPARMDDLVTVRTRLTRSRGASIDLAQRLFLCGRPGEGEPESALLIEAEVRVACIDAQGRPARLPRLLADELATL